MYDERGRAVLAAALAAVSLLAGCAATPGPVTGLPSSEEYVRGAHGAWVEIEIAGGGAPIEGELLGVDEGALVVLSGEGPVTVLPAEGSWATSVLYDNQASVISGATALGVLLCAGTGVYFFAWAPITLLVGVGGYISQAEVGVQKVPAEHW